MLGRTDRRWRSVAILLVMSAFAVSAVLRLAYWQVAMAPELQEKAAPQLARTASQPAVRGDILDRNGQPLATTGYRDTLAGYPNKLTTPERQETVAGLATILGLEADDPALAAIDAALTTTKPYAVLRRGLTADQSRAVRAGLAKGVLHDLTLLPQLVRIYPNEGGQPGTTLASQLLGFVSATDTGSSGNYGIEAQYDHILAGGNGDLAAVSGTGGRLSDSSTQVGGPGGAGQSIRISIDFSLQLQLEKELVAAWTADKASHVSGLVMDPKTGEILAWASVPGYDANDGGNAAHKDPALVQDPIVAQPYEPGSVMKMLTATSAIENHVVTPDTRILDTRSLSFGSKNVHNWDGLGMGRMPFRDIIAFSRNVGVSRVAARLGRTTARAAATLYATWHKMGIGVRTGVDVPGEVPGSAPDPGRKFWAPIDLANRAFGQSVTATPIQLASAFTAMINGGTMVQPHYLVAVGDTKQSVPPGKRVLPKRVANQLLGLLHHVTSSVSWYAAGSLIQHYQVGGKTGTAQIWNPSLGATGKYDLRYYNFSFVGYVGGDTPSAVVAVHIDHARPLPNDATGIKLNETSFQLFRGVAKAVIRYLDVPRSTDPKAGQPEPGSQAERLLEPARYYRRMHRAGHGR